MTQTAMLGRGLAHSLVRPRAWPGITPRGVRGKGATWGEGFEGDEWADLTRVRDWRFCAPDEYIRAFPALLPTGDGGERPLPPCLLGHLAGAIRRLADDGTEASVTRRPDARPWPLPRSLAGRWARRSATRRASAAKDASAPDIRRETAALGCLTALHDRLRAGERAPYDAALAGDLAFWAGIHPAYLWPEALVSHEFFTAVGWLGHATRSGRAFLLRDVAAYFQSVLARAEDGGCSGLDPALGRYLGSPELAATLLQAARQRMIRPGVVVRCRPGTLPRRPDMPGGRAVGV